jgi:DNA-binding beta-propeller fold protein YncE
MLAVLDTGTGRVLRRVPVGVGAHDVAVGDVAWVRHGAHDAPLTLLSLYPRPRRPAPNRTLPAEGPAHDIERAPDTADVFVTYWDSGVVARLRTGVGAGRTLWRRRVGTVTHHLAFDPYSGRRLWVSDRAGLVLLLSADTGRTLRSFGGCPGPHRVAVLSSRAAVAACNASGTLAVFEATNGRVRSLPVGHGPHDVAVVQVP